MLCVEARRGEVKRMRRRGMDACSKVEQKGSTTGGRVFRFDSDRNVRCRVFSGLEKGGVRAKLDPNRILRGLGGRYFCF